MKMTRVTSVAVLLIFAVAYGEALKCYEGVVGLSEIAEKDCAGSCASTETTSGDTKLVVLVCSPISYTGPCVEVAGTKICYCNTDLCNTGSSGGGGGGGGGSGGSGGSGGGSDGSGGSDGGGGGSGGSGGGGSGGGTTMKPSGSSALVVTWTVTCLVAIATAAGRAVF